MSEPFIGEVKMFGGTFAPRGWAYCNGQLLPIAENEPLFFLIGTTYGGDGQTTFALPDLQGRAPMHAGQGVGLTPRTLGEMTGAEGVTLLTGQIPSHTHQLNATATPTTGAPGNTVALASTSGPSIYRAATNLVPMGAVLSPNSGGQPHENRQPYLAVSFIIALEGIFPSRS
jgi:microcystin-dependent protein